MSFSSSIKEELCRLDTKKTCCIYAELAVVFFMNMAKNGNHKVSPDAKKTQRSIEGGNIRIVTENAAFARRVFSLIRDLFQLPPDIIIRKNRKLKKNASYIICLEALRYREKMPEIKEVALKKSLKRMNMQDVLSPDIELLKRITTKKCCKQAALRGAFLAGGSVSDPEKLYHLEIFCKKNEIAEFISDLMRQFGLKPKIVSRNDYYVVYIKESESIVDFLNISGAHKSLMSLENIRILKEMRNSVNRIVNCETANLEKTVNAAIRQKDNIMLIKDHYGFEKLPRNLREIAELRIENWDIGLKELGQMLDPMLGKSGTNHRLRKLDEIAEELRSKLEDEKKEE